MARGAYIFVAAVFAVLAAAFLASTASVIYEFRAHDWPAMLIAHSHQFIFFPTLGLIALGAFYLPSVVFTDLYCCKGIVTAGRLRFALGAIVLLALSLYLSNVLHSGTPRGVWEVSPDALASDETAGPAAGPRRPIRTVFYDTMAESGRRLSISQFARNCSWDRKVERPVTDAALRYCIPSGTMLSTDDCCRVQHAFRDHVTQAWSNSATRSKASDYDRLLLPFKVFFVVILVVIGCFLSIWRNTLKAEYVTVLPRVERGVLIGALLMLAWPLMDYGYQQTSDVMFGRDYSGVNPRMSLVFVPWAALLLLYFIDFGKDSDRIAQISTVVGGGVAVLRYQEINDLSARILGSGAAWWHFAALLAAGVGALIWLYRAPVRPYDAPRPPRGKAAKVQASGASTPASAPGDT